jgi:eukaryotic-like serine/threonine-protein kinase
MPQAELQQRLSEIVGSKYQILCRIGGGGMAQVFLARHRFHGGLFAIKVLAEHLAGDPSIVSRFEHEARMAASLANHPNIVPIFDIGEGDGIHYLVMQFISGEDLASYLRRQGPVSLAAAANVIAQATEALSCAEARHIVHRDLKPANMLLDETGRIKLLDFGISRIADVSDGLTRPGESVGTPYYMSPEQVRGEPCDIRSDLYAVGVVFFELLSGHRPFENESAPAVQIAHLTTPPPSLLAYQPSLPPACDAIVQKLLAKRPEDRYQSTSELLETLVSYGANAGPGELRPSVNPGLQDAIRCAQQMPLERQPSSATPSSTRSISDAPTMPLAAANGPAPLPAARPSVATAPADTSAAPQSSRRIGLTIAISSAVLVLIAALAVLWLRHPRPVAAPTTTAAAPAPPPVYSDTHGRMLLVPAGAFIFGAQGGHDGQNLTLPAFYIDETEVSNAEYRAFCEATGHAPPQTPDYTAHADYPVGGISWQDAAAYAAWAGKRLPTEEEWEKAARGADGRTFPWGNTPWTGDVPTGLQPVGANPLRRSPLGAYNMAGNVWEWTATSYTPTSADTVAMQQLLKGQSFSTDWRIIKGGSFRPGDNEDFDVAKHRPLPVDARSPWIGFRCARNAPPA